MLLRLVQDTDSYKLSHWLQYPPGTESMFSYLESRGVDGKFREYHQPFEELEEPYTVFFGLQYYIQQYLIPGFTQDDISEAAELFASHGVPFNEQGFRRLREKHGNRLPIRIRAVPEGTSVPLLSPLVTVESTDPEFYWLVSYIETLLSRLWYPTTVATVSHSIRKLISRFLDETADNTAAEINFKLHDFGSRGVSSSESAQIGGAAHLINFMGSDTLAALFMIKKYYGDPCAGFSIPAAEHSTITSWGRENEVEAYRNMLAQFAKPGSLVAVVSDSYDLWNAIDNLWGGSLRESVVSSGATVVVRPDSGNPFRVVREAAERLDARFGHTINSKGYKVLNNVRIIQGDGINKPEIWRILSYLKEGGYSASNIAFGMGGALLQKMDRDSFKFAYKCSSITRNGQEVDVYKDPVTDHGKKSKAGRLDLVKTYDGYYPARLRSFENASPLTVMRTVYQNGLTDPELFTDIRLRTMA